MFVLKTIHSMANKNFGNVSMLLLQLEDWRLANLVTRLLMTLRSKSIMCSD